MKLGLTRDEAESLIQPLVKKLKEFETALSAVLVMCFLLGTLFGFIAGGIMAIAIMIAIYS